MEVRNRLLMSQGQVAAEVAASDARRRRWLVIHPIQDGAVELIQFEHSAEIDTDAWLAPEDILDRKKERFPNLDSLLAELVALGIDTDVFDFPWKTDFPL